jgi:hypothetical protein
MSCCHLNSLAIGSCGTLTLTSFLICLFVRHRCLLQVWLRKLGGADVQINELGPITKVGTGRRMGQIASDDDVWTPSAAYQASIAADAAAAAAAAEAGAANAAAGALPGLEQQQQQTADSSSQGSLPAGERWARRKRAAARPAAAPSSA